MLAGAYSNQYRALEQSHVEKLKESHRNERIDLLSRQKRLAHETHRRRKLSANKRKNEAEREERRRREILQKRREVQREATERFQRGNRTYKTRAEEEVRKNVNKHTAYNIGLEDALKAIRGSPQVSSNSIYQYGIQQQNSSEKSNRYGSASSAFNNNGNHGNGSFHSGNGNRNVSMGSFSSVVDYKSNYGVGAYALDRNNTETGNKNTNDVVGNYGVANGNGIHSNAQISNSSSQSVNGYQNKYARQLQLDRAREHAREIAARAELHSHSLSNMNNSRSRFEAQLEQHQQLLVDQQRQTLHEFNAAIQHEIDADRKLQGEEDVDDGRVLRSESLSSIDSLEVQMGKKDQETVSPSGVENGSEEMRNLPHSSVSGRNPSAVDYYGGDMNKYVNSATTCNHSNLAGFNNTTTTAQTIHPNIAVVRPSSQTPPRQEEQHVFFTHNAPNGTDVVINDGSGDGRNATNELLLEDANEVVQDALEVIDQKAVLANVENGKNHWVNKVNGRTNVHLYHGEPVTVYNAGVSYHQPHPPGQSPVKLGAIPYNAEPHPEPGVHQKAWATPTPDNGSSDGDKSGFASTNDKYSSRLAASYAQPSGSTSSKPYSVHTAATPVIVPTCTVDSASAGRNPHSVVITSNQQIKPSHPQSTTVTMATIATMTTAVGELDPSGNNGWNRGGIRDKTQEPVTMVTHQMPDLKSVVSKGDNGTNAISSHSVAANTTESVSAANSAAVRDIPAQIAAASRNGTAVKSNYTIPVKCPPSNNGHSEKLHKDGVSSGNHGNSSSKNMAKQEKKEIKGILKPSSSPGCIRGKRLPCSSNSMHRQNSDTRRTGGSFIRDSLEVTKEHLSHRDSEPKKKKKKSVRFADMLYEEEGSIESVEEDAMNAAVNEPPPPPSSPTEAIMYEPRPPTQNKNTSQNGVKSRPISAKIVTSTPKVDPQVKEPRVSSAGTIRRGPFVRSRNTSNNTTANNHPSSVISPSVTNANQNNKLFSKVSYSNAPNTSSSAKPGFNYASLHQNRYANQSEAVSDYQSKRSTDGVYDINGLRLDRTPTDDEINWLWDKVRTCLHRENGQAAYDPNNTRTTANYNNNQGARTTAHVAQKYIDGNTLASQFQTSTRIGSNFVVQKENSNLGNFYSNRPVTTTLSISTTTHPANSATYGNKRAASGLLQHRKQNSQPPNSLKPYNVNGKTQSNGATSQQHYVVYQAPTQSSYNPVMTDTGHGREQDAVSASMAAFLAAEKYSGQSLSESEIQMAMELAHQRQNGTRNNAPSTLSLEEQRLMQSLERLNERLKVTEAAMDRPHVGAFVPRPPPSGFRGHQPLSSHRRLSNSGSANTRRSQTSPHSLRQR